MLFYRTVRRLFRCVAVPMFRFEVRGAEQVPRHGPAVVVAPHRSWLDPPCVGAASPRPVRFLITDKVYHVPWTRWFYRGMKSIPVTPGGTNSMRALRTALRSLKQGEVVGVFPEGRVLPEGDLGRVHPGAAMLAVQVQAPVVPMFIKGSARAWPHGRRLPGPAPVSVIVGQPIQPPPKSGRGAIEEMVRRIEDALRELAKAERS